jgi:flagellar assembly factor FliW
MTDPSALGWLTEERQLNIPGGLLGLPEWEAFVWVPAHDRPLLGTLRSEDPPGISLLAGEPLAWMDAYEVEVCDTDRVVLQAEAGQDLLVLVLLTLDDDPPEVWANTLGPLILNPATGLARQVVQAGRGYLARQPVSQRPSRPLLLPEGLIGFPHLTDFDLRPLPLLPGAALLASRQQPDFSLTVARAQLVAPHYAPSLGAADRIALQAESETELEWYVILNLPPDSGPATANLLGPIVILPAHGLGRQVILSHSGYRAAEPLGPQPASEGAHARPDA